MKALQTFEEKNLKWNTNHYIASILYLAKYISLFRSKSSRFKNNTWIPSARPQMKHHLPLVSYQLLYSLLLFIYSYFWWVKLTYFCLLVFNTFYPRLSVFIKNLQNESDIFPFWQQSKIKPIRSFDKILIYLIEFTYNEIVQAFQVFHFRVQ